MKTASAAGVEDHSLAAKHRQVKQMTLTADDQCLPVCLPVCLTAVLPGAWLTSFRVHSVLEKFLKMLEFGVKTSRPFKVLENTLGA